MGAMVRGMLTYDHYDIHPFSISDQCPKRAEIDVSQIFSLDNIHKGWSIFRQWN